MTKKETVLQYQYQHLYNDSFIKEILLEALDSPRSLENILESYSNGKFETNTWYRYGDKKPPIGGIDLIVWDSDTNAFLFRLSAFKYPEDHLTDVNGSSVVLGNSDKWMVPEV